MKKVLLFLPVIIIGMMVAGTQIKAQDTTDQQIKPFTYMGDSIWITTTEYVQLYAIILDSLESVSRLNRLNSEHIGKIYKVLQNTVEMKDKLETEIAYKDSINQANQDFIDELLKPKLITVPFIEFQTEIGPGTAYYFQKEDKSDKFYRDLKFYGYISESIIINRKFKITGEVKIPESIELKAAYIIN